MVPVIPVPTGGGSKQKFVGPPSPHRLLQEEHAHDPWRVIVCCVFLNCTTRTQVDRVLPNFLLVWPSANDCLGADADALAETIKSLGFKNRRAERLIKMSSEFVALGELTPESLRSLYGVGEYAARAVEIFCLGLLGETEPADHALVAYWSWARENRNAYESGWSGRP